MTPHPTHNAPAEGNHAEDRSAEAPEEAEYRALTAPRGLRWTDDEVRAAYERFERECREVGCEPSQRQYGFWREKTLVEELAGAYFGGVNEQRAAQGLPELTEAERQVWSPFSYPNFWRPEADLYSWRLAGRPTADGRGIPSVEAVRSHFGPTWRDVQNNLGPPAPKE